MEKILSWKIGKKQNVMAVKNILKKSWQIHGISLLLMTNHAQEVPIIPHIYRPPAVIWLWGLSVCLPGIMENCLYCHGKVMEFYYQISVGTVFIQFKFPHRLRESVATERQIGNREIRV